MRFVEFQEAGVRFEIQGPLPGGAWLVGVHRPGSGARSYDEPTWPSVCGRVDLVLAEAGVAYGGHLVDVWRHESRHEEILSLPTRGALLRIFDEGESPSVEELAEHLECTGDVVLEIRNGIGEVLLDRRATARVLGLLASPSDEGLPRGPVSPPADGTDGGISDGDLAVLAGLGRDGTLAFREQLVSRTPIDPEGSSEDRVAGLALANEYKTFRSGPAREMGSRISPVAALAALLESRKRRESGESLHFMIPPALRSILSSDGRPPEQALAVEAMTEMIHLAGHGRLDVLDEVFRVARPADLHPTTQMTLLRGAFRMREFLPSWSSFRDRCVAWMIDNDVDPGPRLVGLGWSASQGDPHLGPGR